MEATERRYGRRVLLAVAAAVMMAAAAAAGAVAVHQSAPGTHVVADDGVVHSD